MSVARCPIFTVLVVCIFSTGCTMQPVYGNSWAAQVRLDDGVCPDIDGTYRNAGERFDFDTHNRRIVSLAHLLNGGFSADAFQAVDRLGATTLNAADDPHQTVSLRLEESALQVEATRTDGGVRTFDLPVRPRCRNSILFIESDWSGGSVVLASGVGRTSLALGWAEDGSLLARASGSGIAFLFWLPIGMGSAADWTIFPPVSPSSRIP
jgi:hypothetical protein